MKSNNTKDATKECLENLHDTTCPVCSKNFKWCKTCTRVIGYEKALKGLSDIPWAATAEWRN